MNPDDFDSLLEKFRTTPPPAFSGNFRDSVWREIQQRRAQAGEHPTFPDWLMRLILQPSGVFALLAVALVTGVIAGNRAVAADAQRTREALHLQVFGNASPSLPSTLLSRGL